MAELAASEGIDLKGSFAYSDSVTDLPMLELVGNPVAVNPDRELRRIATERSWRIESFRNPVTLRSRLPQLKRPEATPAGGLVATAGVVGLIALAWWLRSRTAAKAE